MKRVVKVALWSVGGVLLAGFALLIIILASWGGEKDRAIQMVTSPDGKLRAELHQDITDMHGGPDRLWLTVEENSAAFGDTVFSEVWECSDDSVMHLAWAGSNELTFQLGRFVPDVRDSPENHRVSTRLTKWHDVSIDFFNSQQIVSR